MTINETISDYQATQNVNIKHIAEDLTILRNNITTATDDTPEANDNRNDDMPTLTITAEDTTLTQDEFFIDTIVSHKVSRSERHIHTEPGEVLYRVRWKGFRPSDDTWKPLPNVTRSDVIYYHHRNKLEIPTLLD